MNKIDENGEIDKIDKLNEIDELFIKKKSRKNWTNFTDTIGEIVDINGNYLRQHFPWWIQINRRIILRFLILP